jgi:2-keto-4-pentenoate hydratase/2-oxohepta-3-ene-1,7-dioic acid hydratase in catechol pathway
MEAIMRFATYRQNGRTCAGRMVDDQLFPLAGDVTVLDLLRQGVPALRAAGDSALSAAPVPVADVRLSPPLEPPTVRDFIAFEEHVEGAAPSVSAEAGVVAEWYQAPVFYFSNPYSIVGPYDDVAIPEGSRQLDFELEVAAVIGAQGSDLTPTQARRAIAGYTILNDWSARDLQRREMRVGLGPVKGKDFATTLGPCLVTADEVERYRDSDGFLDLEMVVEVNGVQIGRDLLSNMAWPFEELVSYASRNTMVRPGDVLGSGTCGNGGSLAELWGRRGRVDPPPLRPGDVVTMTVHELGVISNTVVAGREPTGIPRARPRPRRRRPVVRTNGSM